VSAFIAIVAFACAGNVAPDLREVYCQAVYAWAPYLADVRQVKWCSPGECTGMGGGVFHMDTRVISIDPQWPFKGNELLLTLEHEYGHALGLGHRSVNSIMKPGWEPPMAKGPTAQDFEEVDRIKREAPGSRAWGTAVATRQPPEFNSRSAH
jgi:hypothetical protein